MLGLLAGGWCSDATRNVARAVHRQLLGAIDVISVTSTESGSQSAEKKGWFAFGTDKIPTKQQNSRIYSTTSMILCRRWPRPEKTFVTNTSSDSDCDTCVDSIEDHKNEELLDGCVGQCVCPVLFSDSRVFS